MSIIVCRPDRPGFEQPHRVAELLGIGRDDPVQVLVLLVQSLMGEHGDVIAVSEKPSATTGASNFCLVASNSCRSFGMMAISAAPAPTALFPQREPVEERLQVILEAIQAMLDLGDFVAVVVVDQGVVALFLPCGLVALEGQPRLPAHNVVVRSGRLGQVGLDL